MVYEAKVVEASGCGPEDSEFESHHTHKKGKVAESGLLRCPAKTLYLKWYHRFKSYLFRHMGM
jgi:hypothetical protein